MKKKTTEPSETPTPTVAAEGAAATLVWSAPAGLSRTSKIVLGLVLVALNLPLIHYYLLRRPQPTTADLPYHNDFSDRAALARDFWSTGGDWNIRDGVLVSPGVKNNPLWLQAALPRDVSVEFDVRSDSPEGDIKVELFGNGTDHASGYVFIHGGWNNSLAIIARLDEHGRAWSDVLAEAAGRNPVDADIYRSNSRVRVELPIANTPRRVEMGRTYHWKIERRGSVLTWSIDGAEFMRFDDPLPLEGTTHNRFGFSSWEAQLYFDNLSIQAL